MLPAWDPRGGAAPHCHSAQPSDSGEHLFDPILYSMFTNPDQSAFRNVSVRGRVAFGICCLENALTALGIPLSDWQLVLSQLWKYTEQARLDDWHEVTAEYLPVAVLEYIPFEKKGCEYLTPELAAALQSLYTKVPAFMHELLADIFETGIIELYGGLVNGGEQSLKYTLRIINLMRNKKLPLPPYEAFQRVGSGWGHPFTRQYLLFSTPLG